MRERPTPEEFKGEGRPRRQGFRGFIERLSPQKKIEGKGEEKEKEQCFIQEFERGDLIIQKHYAGKEEPGMMREISDIKLINKKGETYSLKSELPEEGRFLETKMVEEIEKVIGSRLLSTGQKDIRLPEFYLEVKEISISENPEGKKAVITTETEKKNFWKEKEGAFLAVFHEIAHTHRFGSEKEYQENIALRLKAAGGTLTEEEKERYEELVVKEERDCWAFALRKIRELRRKGFDVEPFLDNPEKLKEFLHSGLYSWEMLIESPRPGQSKEEELIKKPQESKKLLGEIAKKVKKS